MCFNTPVTTPNSDVVGSWSTPVNHCRMVRCKLNHWWSAKTRCIQDVLRYSSHMKSSICLCISSCLWFDWFGLVSCVSVRNKQKKLCVCAVLLVYFFNTLKSVKWPSVERASTLPITPLPAAPLDSGQCAKQLWKRPHAFSLIECPLRNVFPTLPHFYQKHRNTHPLLSCKIGSPPSMTWWSSSGLS